MNARVFTPPCLIEKDPLRKSVFIAGSIEMGKARNWQSTTREFLMDLPIDIYNPRREQWDASWKQEISDPNFSGQVRWELNQIAVADVVGFYFDPNTLAPISLFELGKSEGKEIVLCCPPGYWRRGNLEIIADEWDIPLYETFEEFLAALREKLA